LPPYDHHPDPIKTIPNDDFNSYANINAPPLPSKNPLSDDDSSVPASGGPPRYDNNQNTNFNDHQANFGPPPPSNKSNNNNFDDDLRKFYIFLCLFLILVIEFIHVKVYRLFQLMIIIYHHHQLQIEITLIRHLLILRN
jgi:hypothetical protein